MARIKERRKAIKMRLAGKTYTHIRAVLGVSKSTLSGWIKDIRLTSEQLKKIKTNATARRIENYIITTKARRKRIFEGFCQNEKKSLLPLNRREYLIAGLFLYLGEGAKSEWWKVQLSNSDPNIIKFHMFWLTSILKVPIEKIKTQIHLYRDMDIEQELRYWENITGLGRKQFMKPYIKKTSSQRIDHPSFGHGTCGIYYNKVELKHKILAGIRVILESTNGRIV